MLHGSFTHCYCIFKYSLNVYHSVLIKIVSARVNEVLNEAVVVVHKEERRNLKDISNTEFPGK